MIRKNNWSKTRFISMQLPLALMAAMFFIVSIGASPLNAKSPEQELRGFFTLLEQSIKAGDINKSMDFYSNEDPTFFQEKKREISNLASVKALEFEIRPNRIVIKNHDANAIVFFKTTYKLHDRIYGKLFWAEVNMKKTNRGWKIVSQDVRDFIKPTDIQLDVEIFPGKGTMEGKAQISYDVVLPHENTLSLELNRGLKVKKLTDKRGKELRYERLGNLVYIKQRNFTATKKNDKIYIEYVGTLFNDSKERGYSQVNIDSTGAFASWVTDWYPMINNETTKCAGTIRYTLPKGWKVASSGLFKGMREKGQKALHTFQVNQPLNFSFATANYFQQTKIIDGIEVGVYFLEGGDKKAKFYIDECSKMIAFFKGVYGFYPYDKYAVVEIAKEKVGTLGGSSEQGMNLFPTGILPDDDSLEFIVSHEIGHSWWGNLVNAHSTVLSEGLAQYSAALWMEHKYGENALLSLLKNGFNTGTRQYSRQYFYNLHKYPEKDMEIGIDRPGKGHILHALADNKGYFVYHMLRQEIGKDHFIKGLQKVIDKYRNKKLKLAEFQKVMEEVSGTDLAWFFEQWFYRKGAPEFFLTYQTQKVANGYNVSGTITQKGDTYRVNAEIGWLETNGLNIRRIEIKEKETPFEFILKEKPEDVFFDPHYKILRWTPGLRNLGTYLSINELIGGYQYEKAETMANQFIKEAPGSFSANLVLGKIYLESKQLKVAEAQFKQTLHIHKRYWKGFFSPAVASSKLSLGKVYDLMGKRAEAVDFYKQVINEYRVKTSLKSDAEKYLKSKFVLAAPFVVSTEKLKTYIGKYQVGDDSYNVTISGGSLLDVSGSNGMRFKMSPSDKDKFTMVGNEDMIIKYLRDTADRLIGLNVFRTGQLLFKLNKVE